MACGKDLAKRLLILFNLIFVLGGLVLFSIGIWIKCDMTVVNNLKVINIQQAKPLLNYSATLFVIVGVVTFVVAIIGLFGALREHQGLLFLFASLVMLVIMVECGAAFLTLFFRMGDKLSTSMFMQSHYLYGHDKVKTSAWDVMQSSVHCCGGNNYKDYYSSTWYNITQKRGIQRNGTHPIVPDSCCASSELESWKKCQNEAASNTQDSTVLYKMGCYNYMIVWLHSHSTILCIVGFITALIQMLTVLMAFCLRAAIKQSAKI